MADPLAPAAFIGHGNPMNALENNEYTNAWRRFGEEIGKPRAVLCVSAHWFINASAVTAMTDPRTIHDFYGFPRALFDFEYPAPGSPAVASEVIETAAPLWVGLDEDSWGLDHGTWAVLCHVLPDADVPVVQLAIDATKPLEYHIDLGARLAPLRQQGVVIVGSGNVVHNLPAVQFNRPDGFDWAYRFDESARAILLNRPGDLGDLAGHRDYAAAVPTPDHFLPLAYFAGLAAASADEHVELLVDGCIAGSLSMASYTLGI
jgi:4,5-DOPA dioxygenase extradiol